MLMVILGFVVVQPAEAVLTPGELIEVGKMTAAFRTVAEGVGSLVDTDYVNAANLLDGADRLTSSIRLLIGGANLLPGETRADQVAKAWVELDASLTWLRPLASAAAVVASLDSVNRALTYANPGSAAMPYLNNVQGKYSDAAQHFTGVMLYSVRSARQSMNVAALNDKTYQLNVLEVTEYMVDGIESIIEISGIPLTPCNLYALTRNTLELGGLDLRVALKRLGTVIQQTIPGAYNTFDRIADAWYKLDQSAHDTVNNSVTCGPGH